MPTGASSSAFTGGLTSAHVPGSQAKLLHSAILRMDTKALNTERRMQERSPSPAASHHLGCRLELYGAGTSPVVQWWRIHLLMQGTQFWSQVREDSTCCRATNPLHHWRRKQTEQALSWKQNSILGWTVDFELYAQYLWKRHTNWETRPPGGRAPWLVPRLYVA